MLLNFGGLGFEALALRFSGFFLLLKRASDGFCSGHLRFGLLCASLQARGRFLRLPAAGLERVRGGFEFLCVFAALCQGFPREPLRKIAGQLLELRGQPARQFGSQRFRCRGTCLARLLIALLVKPFQRPRSFIRDFHAPCGKLLLPLFQRETAFGGDRVRSGLLGSGLNLLSRVGDQSSYLSRQLERRIGGTGRRRKDPHIVARIGPWELGFAERSWRLGFQNSCGRRQGWWHGCAVNDRRRMHALRESKPVFRRKCDAPQVSGHFQFHRHLKELADGPRSLDPGHAAPHRSRWLSGFRVRNFQLHPHIL